MSLKVNILEIICVVHANDINPNWIPNKHGYHYIGGYINNNIAYPIYVVMKGEAD